MSETFHGGPAFPSATRVEVCEDGQLAATFTPGMTLLDWFAGQALAGLLASGPHDCEADGIAHDAYLHAQAMIDRRAALAKAGAVQGEEQ